MRIDANSDPREPCDPPRGTRSGPHSGPRQSYCRLPLIARSSRTSCHLRYSSDERAQEQRCHWTSGRGVRASGVIRLIGLLVAAERGQS